jgi:hypothetical protein
MSSSKRYIWYFTLQYQNLLSKHLRALRAKRKNTKGFGGAGKSIRCSFVIAEL